MIRSDLIESMLHLPLEERMAIASLLVVSSLVAVDDSPGVLRVFVNQVELALQVLTTEKGEYYQ